jgi:hypothetical protein
MLVRTVAGFCLTFEALLALARPAASAENANACADAYELTQSEERAGQLLDARKDARLCAARCPRQLAKDCIEWEARISSRIPSFAVHAHGSDGAPLAVEVQVDGAAAVFTSTGSIEAEPGPHHLVLVHSGVPVEARVDLVAGARNQIVEVTIADTPPVPVVSSSAREADHRPIPLWRWLVGGLGLATVAAGGAVSISGEVLNAQFRGSCAPHCTGAQADEVLQRWYIGGALMGVGAALSLTAVLWPGSPRVQRSAGSGPTAGVSLLPGWAALEGTF